MSLKLPPISFKLRDILSAVCKKCKKRIVEAFAEEVAEVLVEGGDISQINIPINKITKHLCGKCKAKVKKKIAKQIQEAWAEELAEKAMGGG